MFRSTLLPALMPIVKFNAIEGFLFFATSQGLRSTRTHGFHVRYMSQMSEIEKKSIKSSSQIRLNDIFVIGAGCIGQGLTASLLKSNIINCFFN